MGAYFIAAGSKSRSRDTLEHPTELAVFEPLLTSDVLNRLRASFDDGESIYVWGAMEAGRSALEQVELGDYVVDVDGGDIVQVFEFAFAFEPSNVALQEALGWVGGSAKPFTHVFFLRRPSIPRSGHRDKSYFQHVFAFDRATWLSRSRYFDRETLAAAMARCDVDTLEDLLGIESRRLDADVSRKADRAPPEPTIDSRQAKRRALRDEVRSDWQSARINLIDASTKLLELATRAMKKADERFRDRDS